MHVFVQHLDGKRVRELHWRDDEPQHGVGYVLGSAYFPATEASLWARMMGRVAPPRWQLPFDSDGTDALGLCERAAAGSARVVGRARAGERGIETLVRDAWSNDPLPWRASVARDFLIAPEDGPPVIVSLGLAPILIAPAHEERREAVISTLDPSHRRLLPPRFREPDPESADSAWVVELRSGDLLEVIGVSRPVQQSTRRLERVGYRDAAPPCDVIGDEDGTRVVLRWIGR